MIDDHPFFRDGVSRGLTNSGLITVVAEAIQADGFANAGAAWAAFNG